MKSSIRKYRKFRSSGMWVGGDSSRYKKLKIEEQTIKFAKDQIVKKLFSRAEAYELKSETASVETAIALRKIAKELRDCGISIRLDSWEDMD